MQETQRCVLLHVTSRRSRDPFLLLRDPAFTVPHSNTGLGTRGGEAWCGENIAHYCCAIVFRGFVLQQLPHGTITPQYYKVVINLITL
jgi:hypothetical protein